MGDPPNARNCIRRDSGRIARRDSGRVTQRDSVFDIIIVVLSSYD